MTDAPQPRAGDEGLEAAARIEWNNLASRAVVLHADLMRAGLLATGLRMRSVVNEVGWEIDRKLRAHAERRAARTEEKSP